MDSLEKEQLAALRNATVLGAVGAATVFLGHGLIFLEPGKKIPWLLATTAIACGAVATVEIGEFLLKKANENKEEIYNKRTVSWEEKLRAEVQLKEEHGHSHTR